MPGLLIEMRSNKPLLDRCILRERVGEACCNF